MGTTKIEWHQKTAAVRIGITFEVYAALRAQGLKFCTACRFWRKASTEHFHADRSRSDGFSSVCRLCKSTRQIAGTKILPLFAQEHKRQNYRNWYRRGGHDTVRPRVQARKRQIDPLPIEAQEFLLETTGGLCIYCGEPATAFDHVLAVKQGGETIPGNIVPACSQCNSSKGTKDVFEWLESKGRAIPLKLLDIMIISEVGFGTHID